MPAKQGEARLEVVTRHWHALAERRLAYFNELYRSGRWARYYSKEHFALRMLEVIQAVRTWRELANRSWANQSSANQSSAEQPVVRDDDLRSAA